MKIENINRKRIIAMKEAGKHICVILLGGTIASIENENGLAEVVDLSEYVKTFRELDEDIAVTVNSFKQ